MIKLHVNHVSIEPRN